MQILQSVRAEGKQYGLGGPYILELALNKYLDIYVKSGEIQIVCLLSSHVFNSFQSD